MERKSYTGEFKVKVVLESFQAEEELPAARAREKLPIA